MFTVSLCPGLGTLMEAPALQPEEQPFAELTFLPESGRPSSHPAQPVCGQPQEEAGGLGGPEALPSAGFSPCELLKLIYDRPAQACGLRA